MYMSQRFMVIVPSKEGTLIGSSGHRIAEPIGFRDVALGEFEDRRILACHFFLAEDRSFVAVFLMRSKRMG